MDIQVPLGPWVPQVQQGHVEQLDHQDSQDPKVSRDQLDQQETLAYLEAVVHRAQQDSPDFRGCKDLQACEDFLEIQGLLVSQESLDIRELLV